MFSLRLEVPKSFEKARHKFVHPELCLTALLSNRLCKRNSLTFCSQNLLKASKKFAIILTTLELNKKNCEN